MQDQQEEARARGSDWAWWVDEDYFVYEGILKKAGGRLNRSHPLFRSHPSQRHPNYPFHYYPFAHPEIVTAVASLNNGDEKAVLEFAYEWGLLGYDNLIPAYTDWVEDFGDYPHGERKWVIRRAERRWGDPLPWVWAHAETVRRVLHLISLLAKCDSAEESYVKGQKQAEAPVRKLETYLSRIASPFRVEDDIYTHFDLAIGITPIESGGVVVYSSGKSEELMLAPMTPQRMARQVIADAINLNLHGVRPMVFGWGVEERGLERSITFPALLPVVYWHLSDAAIGGKTYIQCQWRGCGKWIQQEHGHQRYCPPPPQAGKESLCSLKARQDKWTKSHRKDKWEMSLSPEVAQEQEQEEDHGEAQA